MDEVKKFRKSVNFNLDFADLGGGIVRGIIEAKTFDMKDELTGRGFAFEGKKTGEVRNGKPVTNFTQKKEVYLPNNDMPGLRKVVLTELLELIRFFEKTLVLEPNTSANNVGQTEKPKT